MSYLIKAVTVLILARAAFGGPIVLHAARLLDVANGTVISPGEVLVDGSRIVEVGQSVRRPAGFQLIDLGTAR